MTFGEEFRVQDRNLQRIGTLAIANFRFENLAVRIADRNVQDTVLAQNVVDDFVEYDIVFAQQSPFAATSQVVCQ